MHRTSWNNRLNASIAIGCTFEESWLEPAPDFIVTKNEFYQFWYLTSTIPADLKRPACVWMAWTFPFCNWLQTYHLGKIGPHPLRFTLHFGGRSRSWSSSRPFCDRQRGSLLVLSLLLDAVLFRIVLSLLMKFKSLFAATTNLFSSLLVKKRLCRGSI